MQLMIRNKIKMKYHVPDLASVSDPRVSTATTKQCTLPSSTIPNFVKSKTITAFVASVRKESKYEND
jgi:hypothetical protein